MRMLGFEFGLELCAGFFWRRHPAVNDHALCQPYGGLHVPILADDMLDMGQAVPTGVLNAPHLSTGAPFDLAPKLPVDGEAVDGGASLHGTNQSIAPLV